MGPVAKKLHVERIRWAVRFRSLCIILLVVISLQNLYCSKRTAPFEPADAPGKTNKWVYDSLKRYYYWSDQMPNRPDYTLPTKDFFASLLSRADRFSAISNERDVLPLRSVYENYGFHYALITHPFDLQQWVGVITMVVPGSIAAQFIKRGDFFTRVNDIVVRPGTAQNVGRQFADGKQVHLLLAAFNDNGTQLVEPAPVSILGGGVPFPSVYGYRYFQKQGIKTGYLAYQQCIESQDNRVLDAVQKIKAAGVTELILDLRFNPGGSVASSAKLAAMLVPAFNPDQVYVVFKGNKHGGTVNQTFRQTIAFSGSSSGRDMNSLQLRNLGLKRIFILTSGATISAAEILCNNLKPYMEVIRIGNKTMGKDEASFRIEDKRSPKEIPWLLMPIVYKIYDAQGRGDYSDGLMPDHVINEYHVLPLPALGQPGDALVDKALELIYGSKEVDTIPLRRAGYRFENIKEVYRSTGARGAIEMTSPH